MVRVSSLLQSRSKAVVCISTPRKYPRSGDFLVNIQKFRLYFHVRGSYQSPFLIYILASVCAHFLFIACVRGFIINFLMSVCCTIRSHKLRPCNLPSEYQNKRSILNNHNDTQFSQNITIKTQ